MIRRSAFETELKVGFFVTFGVILLMAGIAFLGGLKGLLSEQISYKVYFSDVSGLTYGAKVMANGMRVGMVGDIQLQPNRNEIRIDLLVDGEYKKWIRKGSIAEIQTQGVLGDKYIAIETPNLQDPILQEGSEIPARSGSGIAAFLSEGEELMANLKSISSNLDIILKSFRTQGRNDVFFKGMAGTAKNLSEVSSKLNDQMSNLKINSAMSHLDSILGKIDNGKGTLGAFVNDPSLYDDIKSLFGGANRNRVMRNLIRQTIKEGDSKDQENITQVN